MTEINFEKFDEKVERFLRGQMEYEEGLMFKAQLQYNPELMERAKTIALAIKEMKSIQKEKDNRLISKIKSLDEPQFRFLVGLPIKTSKTWPKLFYFLLAACVIGVIFTISIPMSAPNSCKYLATDEQYLAFKSDFNDVSSFRGNVNDSLYITLDLLFSNVRCGVEIEHTIVELKKLYDQSSDENSELFEYRDDVAWNLSFAYISKGDKDSAITILEEMLQRNKEWPVVTKPISDLLMKLKSFEDEGD